LHTGAEYDADGALAASGKADEGLLKEWLAHPYFKKAPTKSLDRHDFKLDAVRALTLEDGAATLAEFTVRAVEKSFDHMKDKPKRWLITGGGRKNRFMMRRLAEVLGVPAEPVETQGWNGDAMEAEGFAYLAVRSLKGLPLSLPSTTGVPQPMPGGVLYKAHPSS